MKFRKTLIQGTIFQVTKSPTNSKVMTVFDYIRHYGPVILLLCMTTSETGLYSKIPQMRNSFFDFWCDTFLFLLTFQYFPHFTIFSFVERTTPKTMLTKVCFKSFVTWFIKLHNFFNICSRGIIQSVVKRF